jgi:hypothetical protein
MTKLTMASTCSAVVGHFNDHGSLPVQCAAHCPMQHDQGFFRKPLVTAIGRLLAPYCPSGRQGNSKQNDDKKMYQKDWPF